MTPTALGVDVAARRGCDVVALDPSCVARPVGRVHTGDDLRALVDDLTPAVVAIDAPPAWAQDGRRECERALSRRGISVFTTPDATRGEASDFYAWMRTGFEMFAAARPLPVLETFPHAVAVALRGHPPEQGLLRRPAVKRQWRREALEGAGVDTTHLRSIDEIDAALCAVTGLRFLEGRTEALGDPTEGVLTVPLGLPDLRRRGTR
ncbi:MAG: DUF429 domain-containing protein [Actinomycetota bacterium]